MELLLPFARNWLTPGFDYDEWIYFASNSKSYRNDDKDFIKINVNTREIIRLNNIQYEINSATLVNY